MDSKILAIQLVSLIFLPVISAYILDYSAVFNFGDSNSDTGELHAGVAFPTKRLCNGYLIIDYLMKSMELPRLNPYLDSVGAPSFHTGCNFAAGGSTILPATAALISPFSLGIQAAQFLRFKSRVFELLEKNRVVVWDLDKNLQNVLPLEDYFKQGLYTFDVGQNDLDGAFLTTSEDQVFALIPTIVTEFETQIEKLHNEGARNFWIHNTGPLGCLPRIVATFGQNSSKLDEFGCVGSHNLAASAFNAQLHDLCFKFQIKFPEANVTYVDIFKIKLDLITNYAQYGFKQGIAACCGYGGPPLNFDSQINCGQTENLNGTLVMATPCSNPAEYVNWDGNHYTEAANQYVSRKILTGKYSETLDDIFQY